jgi:hypothetical protein
VELNNQKELKKVFNWSLDPVLDDDDIYKYEHAEDLNERRIRDAESVGTVVRNINPSTCLDIGTSTGHSAAMMALNAPQAQIYTVNIPPEEAKSGEGGVLITVAIEREKIGSYYRERGLKNIHQILANTATWSPDIGKVDAAFIDGCHDTEFVFNDTCKILPHTHSGSFIMWHDFNPAATGIAHWIFSVCKGVDLLYEKGFLSGPIYQILDSWVGIYRVP